MKTLFSEELDFNNVLPEYPRPQMVRESYINLNGSWDYAINNNAAYTKPDGSIIVPFSPETELSGVGRTLKSDETLWYHRKLSLPDGFNKGRVLLHFGAVDQAAEVFVNGSSVTRHLGGYTPFSADITDYITDGENDLIVRVRDSGDTGHHSRGKQSSSPKGIWYTPQSGIWQTVWAESVPEEYITGLKITPHYDDGALELCINTNADGDVTFEMSGHTEILAANTPCIIKLDCFESWTPDTPVLYDFSVSFKSDSVKSYFAMRKIHISTGADGKPRIFLNNKELFQTGLLDQGYWPDGLYTAPTDEALVYDIELAKSMGFNMLRKHIKIEPLRWYYHCDRLGMLVWQDMINGGGKYNVLAISSPLITGIHFKDNNYRLFARDREYGRKQYYIELKDMINHLYNCPCIVLWVPFNEGWGQFDALKAEKIIREMDPTRLIDHASGWHDQGGGDIQSRHIYFMRCKIKKDKYGRPAVLSEFGGYSMACKEHTYSEKIFGYKVLKTPEELNAQYKRLFEDEIIPLKADGLAATVYTQLTDVEDEINGLATYDRKIIKLDRALVADLNRRLIEQT